ncbi:LOW QUALITY PROTEIN: uncharacterized protein LOC122192214 [Lagopus leucura]|uniref:LOW QUALITY PROTEIN: uncharacterized protein LOC122192214 n=1 Tax=Lagopus leucura TaxID=30410 RepID=UPI001C6823F0|nr:LOW QUALITY PROTEIN: uncharacterized protein LOC122192214 [Lagopus leucura]
MITCLWTQDTLGRSFKFKVDLLNQQTTDVPYITPTRRLESVISPQIYQIGPYAIKNTGQRQVIFNPTWSLKRVMLLLQTNVSTIKPDCALFLGMSYAGWSAWLHRQALDTLRRAKRDVSGILGTGLGVLNSIDTEILMSKLNAITSNIHELQHPLQSSLSGLGTSQWLLSDVLPQWEKIDRKDHLLIMDALSAVQGNTSLALSCIQAQMWMQFIAATIMREGEDGTIPTEIRKVIWDNANRFERKFQSWWHLVNFTYDPVTNYAVAFVLMISNASVYTIYPIIALGLNHGETTLYPIEHRIWALQKNEKWQTVDVSSCAMREQQGFICESNTFETQDICFDTEQNICHFEVQPGRMFESMLVYIGKGCACIRTHCDSIQIGDMIVDTANHSNLCVCNFINILGCDFNYTVPVTSYQLLQFNYTLIKDLRPALIGMNLALVKELLQHDDLHQLLERIKDNGQKTLITVHHDVKKIHRILERVMKAGEHHWWEVLFGWSPTATGIFNSVLHPVVVILGLIVLCLVLIVIIYKDMALAKASVPA